MLSHNLLSSNMGSYRDVLLLSVEPTQYELFSLPGKNKIINQNERVLLTES